MTDSRKGLEAMTKRELVAALAREIDRWDGVQALGRTRDRMMSAVIDRLQLSRGQGAEQHWITMSVLWLSEARRKPADGRRETWLELVADWQSFLEEFDPLADERPSSR